MLVMLTHDMINVVLLIKALPVNNKLNLNYTKNIKSSFRK